MIPMKTLTMTQMVLDPMPIAMTKTKIWEMFNLMQIVMAPLMLMNATVVQVFLPMSTAIVITMV